MPKPKYQINITEAVEKDLGDIIDYISADNPTAAFKVATRIEKNILKLENFPLIGIVPRIRHLALKGYRILIVDDYLVFYYRGLRRPLYRQSRQRLPFALAVLAFGFPLKDASHAKDNAFKRG
jgi:addiction module RelE/StbE family toxin